MRRWMQSNRDRTDEDWLSCAGGCRGKGTQLTEPKKGHAHRQNFSWIFSDGLMAFLVDFGSPLTGHPRFLERQSTGKASLMEAEKGKAETEDKDKPW